MTTPSPASVEPITVADRERAKGICEKVTEGPWTVIQDDRRWKVINAVGDAELGNWTVGDMWWRENANFIAFSRTAIPSYEARVVELEAALAQSKSFHADAEAWGRDLEARLVSDHAAAEARATALLKLHEEIYATLQKDLDASDALDEIDTVITAFQHSGASNDRK